MILTLTIEAEDNRVRVDLCREGVSEGFYARTPENPDTEAIAEAAKRLTIRQLAATPVARPEKSTLGLVPLPAETAVDSTAYPAGVRYAILHSHNLRFRYTDAQGTVTERRVSPRRMYSDNGVVKIDALDLDKGERRTFRLDRIESLEATP